MLSQKTILSLTLVSAFGILSAFSAPQATNRPSTPAAAPKPADAGKQPATKVHVMEGSVVSVTNESLTLRSGKKDMTFKLNSTTKKPASITPGNSVKITYHDDGTQHIASDIEAMAPKSSLAAKQPARK